LIASAFIRSDERFLRAADRLGDGHGNVVGGFDHQDLQGAVERQLLAGLEIHLGRRLGGGPLAHHDRRIEADLAGADRVETRVDRHQLGQRCRIPLAEGFLMLEHAAALDIDQDMRIGIGLQRSTETAMAAAEAARVIGRKAASKRFWRVDTVCP
jgi:hypothetical protein